MINKGSRVRDDAGVALVMAMGIALIGISVATVVIGAVIVAANDSGRDRVRTTEIHTAEGALDATLAELETASPCPAPSFSGATYGSGTNATTVDVLIEYYDDAGPVACAGSLPASTPTRAIVTATSTGNVAQVGVQPVRMLQSEVLLTPRTILGADAAIFSAGDFNTNAAFTLSPADPGESADIWIDNGDWGCGGGSSQVQVYGAVYLPGGELTVTGSNCLIDGNAWVQNDLNTSGTGGTQIVNGSLTVRSGNLDLQGAITVGQDVTAGGTLVGSQSVTAGGAVNIGVGAGAIPNLAPVGLPQVELVPGDWSGFTVVGKSSFDTALNSAWGGSNDACDTWKKATPAVQLSTIPTVYDLTSCAEIKIQKATLALRADAAIFLNDLTVTQTFNVVSGDGNEHNLWLIAPYSSGGSIDANVTGLSVDPKIASFWYAPGTIDVNPGGSLRGQIYGGNVSIKNGNGMEYVGIGIPGVDLVQGTTYLSGFEVELTYKREVS